MKNRKNIAILLIIIICAMPFYATNEGAKLEILNLMDKLAKNGYTLTNDFDYALLNKGDKIQYDVTLYAKIKYIYAAAGCETAKDVNVKIYDESWKLISEDNTNAIDSFAQIVPKLTGTYHVVVTLVETLNNAKQAHICLTSGYN